MSTAGAECEMKIRPMEQPSPEGFTIKQKKGRDVSSSEIHSEGYETMTTSDLISEVHSFSCLERHPDVNHSPEFNSTYDLSIFNPYNSGNFCRMICFREN